jgi:hypothetical protein
VNLSHLFNDKSFCVGQNSISHVKLMQNKLKQEKKMLIKTSFFSKKLCCYFGYHSQGYLAMFGYNPKMKSSFNCGYLFEESVKM